MAQVMDTEAYDGSANRQSQSTTSAVPLDTFSQTAAAYEPKLEDESDSENNANIVSSTDESLLPEPKTSITVIPLARPFKVLPSAVTVNPAATTTTLATMRLSTLCSQLMPLTQILYDISSSASTSAPDGTKHDPLVTLSALDPTSSALLHTLMPTAEANEQLSHENKRLKIKIVKIKVRREEWTRWAKCLTEGVDGVKKFLTELLADVDEGRISVQGDGSWRGQVENALKKLNKMTGVAKELAGENSDLEASVRRTLDDKGDLLPFAGDGDNSPAGTGQQAIAMFGLDGTMTSEFGGSTSYGSPALDGNLTGSTSKLATQTSTTSHASHGVQELPHDHVSITHPDWALDKPTLEAEVNSLRKQPVDQAASPTREDRTTILQVLQQDNEALALQVTQHSQERKSWNEESNNLAREIHKLREQCQKREEAQRAQQSRHEREQRSWLEEKDKLSHELSELRMKSKQRETEQSAEIATLRKQIAQHTETAAALQTLQSDHAHLLTESRQHDQERRTLADEASLLREQLETRAELTAVSHGQNTVAQVLQRENETLRWQLIEVNWRRRQDLFEANNTLRDEVATLNERIKEFEDAHKTLVYENKTLRLNQQKSNNIPKEIIQLRDENTALLKRNSDMRKDADRKQEEHQNRVDRISNGIKTVNLKNEDLRKALKDEKTKLQQQHRIDHATIIEALQQCEAANKEFQQKEHRRISDRSHVKTQTDECPPILYIPEHIRSLLGDHRELWSLVSFWALAEDTHANSCCDLHGLKPKLRAYILATKDLEIYQGLVPTMVDYKQHSETSWSFEMKSNVSSFARENSEISKNFSACWPGKQPLWAQFFDLYTTFASFISSHIWPLQSRLPLGSAANLTLTEIVDGIKTIRDGSAYIPWHETLPNGAGTKFNKQPPILQDAADLVVDYFFLIRLGSLYITFLHPVVNPLLEAQEPSTAAVTPPWLHSSLKFWSRLAGSNSSLQAFVKLALAGEAEREIDG